MPKVSVWLTSYDHGELLKESIESVLCQTYQDFELVIMDDCSTDHSQEIIREYARNNPKIRTILHEKNWGYSGIEKEVEHFAGEYVAVLHGDDKWQEDKLEKQVEVLEQHENIAACFTGVQVIGLDGKAYTGSQAGAKAFKAENRTRYEWLHYFFYNGNCICHPSMMIRKSAFEQYGILKAGLLASLPDFYEWVKLCFHADIHIIPEELTLFRIHEDESSQSGETEGKLYRTYLEEYFIYQTYFCIHDMQTLMSIFPESREYIKNGECIVEFALAKIFLGAPRKSQKLLGLNMLGELLQDKETKKKLKELYDYGVKDYNLEKQQLDIFGNIGRERFLMAALYVNTGDGYNDVECITKKAFIPATQTVRLVFDIGAGFSDKKIQGLRFDPDGEMYRACSIIKAQWEDGEDAIIRPANGITEGAWDRFYTLDPQYEIVPGEHKVLHLILKVESLPAAEVEMQHESVERKVQELERKLAESQAAAEKYRLMLGEHHRLLEEYRSSIAIRAVHKLRKEIGRKKQKR